MATGALDSNGVWQYGEDDSISPWSPYMNLGQGSVSTALAAVKNAVGAVVKVSDTTVQTSAAGADMIYTSATLVLTPGTWQIIAGASVANTGAADYAAVSVYDFTNSADITDSRGVATLNQNSLAAIIGMVSRPVVVTITATTSYRVKVIRNSASPSALRVAAAVNCPAVYLDAVRLR